MIPYFDIKPTQRERELLLRAFDSSWWSNGLYVSKMEESLTNIFNNHVLVTSNGTTALMLAYMALDLQPFDEIIVPGFAFMAAANIAKRLHIEPVFIDVKEDTWVLDESKIEKAITKRTKAIVVVHTYGVMCNMDAVCDIAKKHNLFVIEDCAESFGSAQNNNFAGTFGDIGTLSFQATKAITTGEGGAVITRDLNLAHKMYLIREHGLNTRGKYLHSEYGLNFRLPNLLAAIGSAQLENCEEKLSRRNEVAEYYKNNIRAESQIYPNGTSVWVYAFKSNKRDALIKELEDHFGIQTRPGFMSPNMLPIYQYRNWDTPTSDLLSQEVISLPTYPELLDSEVEYICRKINQLL